MGDALLMYTGIVSMRWHLPCFEVCWSFGLAGWGRIRAEVCSTTGLFMWGAGAGG